MQSVMTIRLPFYLAIPDGFAYVSQYEFEGRKIAHRIDFSSANMMVQVGPWDDDPNFEIADEEPKKVTLTTIKTDIDYPGEPSDLRTREVFKVFFLSSLEYLNRIINCYRIAARDYTVREITFTDLPAMIRMTVDDLDLGYLIDVPRGTKLKEEDDAETTERLQAIGSMLSTWDSWPQFVTARAFYASARNYLEQGRHAQAIIELETSFELQVRMATRMILDDHKIPEPRRSKVLGMPLRNLMEQHLAAFLGISLSYANPGPIADWYSSLYTLRNECVHEGRMSVTGTEVLAAFDAYHTAEDHIAKGLSAIGILSPLAQVNIARFAPRRRVEVNADAVAERLQEIGFFPNEHGVYMATDDTNKQESPSTPTS